MKRSGRSVTIVLLVCGAFGLALAADAAPQAPEPPAAKPAAKKPAAAKPAATSAATKPAGKAAKKPAAKKPATEASAAKAAAAPKPDPDAQETTGTVAPLPGAELGPLEALGPLRVQAIEAYNRRDWGAAAVAADAYEKALEATDLPPQAADHALVQFIGGQSRYEIWKANPGAFGYDFDRDVIGAMEQSLAVVADDPFYKHYALGSAYYDRLENTPQADPGLESAANGHMLVALRARASELRDAPRDGEEYTAFAKYALQYISRAFAMARRSAAPDVYLVRVREACRLGFGSTFDERFRRLYDVVGFDDGNVRAAVTWQAGLDLMNTEGANPEEVLKLFQEAAEATRNPRDRAEIRRQMADLASRQDDFGYKVQAVDHGREAYAMHPSDDDIRAQYGTSLHVLSFSQYAGGRYEDALESARHATAFPWEGDEAAYFDLSRAEAALGDKVNALVHAETAFRKARSRVDAAALQPFRQNYANILRQFGLTARARQVEADGQGG